MNTFAPTFRAARFGRGGVVLRARDATGISLDAFQDKMRAQGIMISGLGGRVRACTHLDVTAPMIDEALGAIRTVLAAA